MEYSSFERVKATLEHKESDRVPFDLGGTMVTGINIKALRNLYNYLHLPGEPKIKDKVTQMAETSENLVEMLNIDIKNVSPCLPNQQGPAKDLGLQGGYYRLFDEFGMGWQMPENGGLYYDLYYSPLKNAETIKDIENYPWPDPVDPLRFVHLKENADRIVFDEKKAYMLGRMNSGMWETAMWMTGYEKFFIDMIINEKLVHAIMEKLLEIKIRYWERFIILYLYT